MGITETYLHVRVWWTNIGLFWQSLIVILLVITGLIIAVVLIGVPILIYSMLNKGKGKSPTPPLVSDKIKAKILSNKPQPGGNYDPNIKYSSIQPEKITYEDKVTEIFKYLDAGNMPKEMYVSSAAVIGKCMNERLCGKYAESLRKFYLPTVDNKIQKDYENILKKIIPSKNDMAVIYFPLMYQTALYTTGEFIRLIIINMIANWYMNGDQEIIGQLFAYAKSQDKVIITELRKLTKYKSEKSNQLFNKVANGEDVNQEELEAENKIDAEKAKEEVPQEEKELNVQKIDARLEKWNNENSNKKQKIKDNIYFYHAQLETFLKNFSDAITNKNIELYQKTENSLSATIAQLYKKCLTGQDFLKSYENDLKLSNDEIDKKIINEKIENAKYNLKIYSIILQACYNLYDQFSDKKPINQDTPANIVTVEEKTSEEIKNITQKIEENKPVEQTAVSKEEINSVMEKIPEIKTETENNIKKLEESSTPEVKEQTNELDQMIEKIEKESEKIVVPTEMKQTLAFNMDEAKDVFDQQKKENIKTENPSEIAKTLEELKEENKGPKRRRRKMKGPINHLMDHYIKFFNCPVIMGSGSKLNDNEKKVIHRVIWMFSEILNTIENDTDLMNEYGVYLEQAIDALKKSPVDKDSLMKIRERMTDESIIPVYKKVLVALKDNDNLEEYREFLKECIDRK